MSVLQNIHLGFQKDEIFNFLYYSMIVVSLDRIYGKIPLYAMFGAHIKVYSLLTFIVIKFAFN